MNVIVPLGGLGTRFQNEGYARPKPFVRVLGKEMILWVLDNLSLKPDDSLVIVFNPAFLSMDVFMREIVQARYNNCTLVELAGPTRGAAETVLFGLLGLPEDLRKRPCMLCDGDCFYTTDIVSMYRAVSATHNATFTFEDKQPKPIYSYVTTSPGTDDVLDIKEKVREALAPRSAPPCARRMRPSASGRALPSTSSHAYACACACACASPPPLPVGSSAGEDLRRRQHRLLLLQGRLRAAGVLRAHHRGGSHAAEPGPEGRVLHEWGHQGHAR